MRVAVCGGSVTGLSAALLLQRGGHDVTVIERDGAPAPKDVAAAWEEWERRGVPQLRQFHAFTAKTRQTLMRALPDVHSALLDAGFAEHPMSDRIRTLFPHSTPEEGDDEMVNLFGRRTTFEWVLRRALEDSGIDLRIGSPAAGVIRTGSAVTGVVCGGAEVPTELVVDATGRRTAADRWLADAGLPTATTADDETGIVYYSRWYRLHPGVDLGGISIPMDILSLRAILTPADDRFVSLAFSVAADDDALKALRRVPAFQAVAQELPRIGEWVHPDRATPVTDVLFMGSLRNRHRTLRDAENEPIAGIVAIGDAATVTNPVFGRGVALGLAHAASLARALDEATLPVEAAERLDRHSEESMREWWEESRNEDNLRRVWMRMARGDQLEECDEALLTTDAAKAHRALPIAMTRDPTVFRLLIRNLTSLDPPERLHRSDVTRRALALVSADELTATPIGRDDLLALLEA